MKSSSIVKSFLFSSLMLPSLAFAASDNQDTPFRFRGDEQQAVQDNPVARMHNQITSQFDEMFRNFFNNGGFTAAGQGGSENDMFLPFSDEPFKSSTFPKTDVVKSKDKIEISVELPGVNKEKIDLQIAPGFLTVSYKEDVKKEEKNKNYMMAERKVGSIRRVIPLPYGADIENAEAKYENGVVYITVPTMDDEKFKPRKIEIN